MSNDKNKKITQLPDLGAIDADGETIVVQAGVTYKYKPALPLNVRAFNASPSASAAVNDEAIAAAIAAAVAEGGPRRVFIPAGVYRISKPIIVSLASGLLIEGAARGNGPANHSGATRFIFEGDQDDYESILDLRNSQYCVIRNIEIAAHGTNPPTRSAVRFFQDDAVAAATNRPSSANHLENVWVSLLDNVPNGCHIEYAAGSSNNNENHIFRSVFVARATEAAFLIGSRAVSTPNAKQIQFIDCSFFSAIDPPNGFYGIENNSGSFTAINFQGTRCDAVFRWVPGSSDPTIIIGGQVEIGARLLWVASALDAPDSTVGPITIDGFRFTCDAADFAADGFAVLSEYNGPLTIRNTRFEVAGDVYVGIRHGTDVGQTCVLITSGNSFSGKNTERDPIDLVGLATVHSGELDQIQRGNHFIASPSGQFVSSRGIVTTDDTPVNLHGVIVPDEWRGLIEVDVVGVSADEMVTAKLSAFVLRTGDTTITLSDVDETMRDPGTTSWLAELDVVAPWVIIKVTGGAADTVRWQTSFRLLALEMPS